MLFNVAKKRPNKAETLLVVRSAGSRALIPATDISSIFSWGDGLDNPPIVNNCIAIIPYGPCFLQLFLLQEFVQKTKWHMPTKQPGWVVAIQSGELEIGIFVEELICWGAIDSAKELQINDPPGSNNFFVLTAEDGTSIDGELVELSSVRGKSYYFI